MNNFNEKANFIWSIADLIRDHFKRSKYQDVILPFTVLRRVDAVLIPTKSAVVEKYNQLKGKIENLDPQLQRASGFAFYNISPFTFDRLLQDAPNLAANLRAYINGFSDNMREVLEKFDFENTIGKLNEAGLLYKVMDRFKDIDLHPDKVSNLEMGYIFEELIRKFNEALNENPGEHFTPREVISLMANLLLAQDEASLRRGHVVRTLYDPCCGTGGMLTVAKQWILDQNANAEVHVFGQEVSPETFAVCKSEFYLKSRDGKDAENIKFGSTLSNDRHRGQRFDYLISNPPYGKEWKQDEEAVREEAEKGDAGRFGAGLPRISDGQMLFLQHMVARMNPPENGGGRIAIVMNGSPLFTGDAGSGETEIRRWVLENDWLDAIIALPESIFYNTGISTYIWILTNRKLPHRAGKVQLIDASSFWIPMRKSLGDKRRQISEDQIHHITQMYMDFEQAPTEYSKIFDTADFGYRKITVERPLRLNFQASAERIERLWEESAFINLAKSKKKDEATKAAEEAEGQAFQEAILAMLGQMPADLYQNREAFLADLKRTEKAAELSLPAAVRNAILSALSERDETADICVDKDGYAEPDPDLRDYESVPLKQSIEEYFNREVLPYVPDAWIDTSKKGCDPKDGQAGKVGYEINFNRYFYQYQAPRPLPEIEADIRRLEKEILEMLRGVTRQ